MSIFSYFARFVLTNMKLMHYSGESSRERKFYLLEVFAEDLLLQEALELFLALKK